MISEEKVKIMAEMARYEKNHGKDDFRVYKYEKKDYILSLIHIWKNRTPETYHYLWCIRSHPVCRWNGSF